MAIHNGWCEKAVFVDGSQPEWRDHLRGVGPPERLCSAYAWLRASTGKTVSLPSLVIARSRYMRTFAWVWIASIGLRLLCLEVRSSRAACAPFRMVLIPNNSDSTVDLDTPINCSCKAVSRKRIFGDFCTTMGCAGACRSWRVDRCVGGRNERRSNQCWLT